MSVCHTNIVSQSRALDADRYTMTTQALPRLLKIDEVCARTSISRTAIYRLTESGQIKAVKIGRSLRFLESEISRFIEELEVA